MKTRQLFFSGVFLVAFALNANAQATQATNAITSTSYVGTSNNFDVIFKRQAIAAGLLGTNKTSFGLNSVAMPNSVSIGVGAGQFSSGAGGNTYIGQNAGTSSLTSTSGTNNTFIGYNAGLGIGPGNGNIAIGVSAGRYNNDSSNNILIGNYAGNEDGSHGNNNIFIGNQAGFVESGENILVIDHAGDTYNPLIWGDMANDRLKLHGKVGISAGGGFAETFGAFPTTAGSVDVSAYNLFVKGGILTEEVRVMLQANWADYVFAKDYKLPTLPEVENFIAKNGHLPNVPSAQQVKEDGIALGEMAKIQQEKIEELTLYILQLNKENEKQAEENAALNERLLKLENLVNNLAK